jgi:uncharacterized membrane protein YgdD (TMEM256/DUF423 family)
MAPGLLAAAALWGALGVAVGALAAHALAGVVTPERLDTFATGVQYHLVHALAAALAASLAARAPGARVAAGLLLAGSVTFSGSLYALVATGAGWLGAVAPLGGAAMIAGWVTLAWAAARAVPAAADGSGRR